MVLSMIWSLTSNSLHLVHYTKNHSLHTMTGSMIVPRLTVKGQKVFSGPVPDTPRPFLRIARIFLPLAILWNYPTHKNSQPHTLGALLPSEKVHILSVECVPLWISPFSLYFSSLLYSFLQKPKTLIGQLVSRLPGHDISFSCTTSNLENEG